MYLSQVLNKPILNRSGERVGKVAEVVVTNLNSFLPLVTGFITSRGRPNKDFFIPADDVQEINNKHIRLSTDIINFTPFERREEEVLLSRHILDKQIVDVRERNLTRINDCELSVTNKKIYLKSVDVSFRAILNRLGFPTRGLFFKYSLIPWQEIQFLGVGLPIRVKIEYDRLESLHPADIARFIFRGPGYREGTRIIQSLEEDIAADVIESLPVEFQVNLIENMSEVSAAKILSEMESHHVADLLAELSEEHAAMILKVMNEAKVKVLEQLLRYPESTAGALMKVEFITIPQYTTVEELYRYLQSSPKLPEFLLYVFVTESATSKNLVGIVSVWELFQAPPRSRMDAIMVRDLVTTTPFVSARTALKKMTQYDLSALPVVNKHNHIIGIVTLSHAIKILIPRSWQTRVNWRE